MFAIAKENRMSLNTNNVPSSSSSPSSITPSLFFKNIPSLSECRPSKTLLTISSPIPDSEVASFLARTFAGADGELTPQDICDMERFTLQDVQHLQSFFAKYKLTDSVNWNDLLGLEMYGMLKQICAFFSKEQADVFLKKWASSYLSSYILCFSEAIRLSANVEDVRKRNSRFASFKDYQRKLNELSQEMATELESTQPIDHSPICIPKSITTKNAKKKYVAEQQKVKREQQKQRKMAVLDLINQWNITAKLVIKFLDCSNPTVIGTSLKNHFQSGQLNPTTPEESLLVIRDLHLYMQMHIDCFTALIAEYPTMLLSVPQFSQQLLPLMKVMVETSDLEQVYGYCRQISKIIKSIKKPLSQSIELINKSLNKQVVIETKGANQALTHSPSCEGLGGISSPPQVNPISLTTQLLHRFYYNFFLLALYADYQNQIEVVMAYLKPEFNNSLSNCHRIGHIINYAINNASSSALMVRPLMKLMEEFDQKILKKISSNDIDQYTSLAMQLNKSPDLFYQKLKDLVGETFNQFIAENRAECILLDEDQDLPEEVICLLYAFTLLYDLGIVLEKEELSNSSDLDILPDAFFALFKLKDQQSHSAADSEPDLVVDSQVSLSMDSGIDKATDSSSLLIKPIDSKGEEVSSGSLETVDEVSSNGAPLLTIDAVQEKLAQKLPVSSAPSDADTGRVSSHLPPSSISTLKHHSKKRSIPRSQPVPAAPVVTVKAPSSVSISENQVEALEDILHTYKRKKIEKILHRLGLVAIPAKGGHTKWKDPSGTFGQTVTSGKEVPKGTRMAIVEQLKTPSWHLKV